MLIKLAGAALVVAAGAGAGFMLAGRIARRPQELRELQAAIALLETEITFGASPLPDAMRQAGRAGKLPARIFAATAAEMAEGALPGEALSRALATAFVQSALQPGDLEPLEGLARVLGSSDREDQQRHLRLCRERLAALEGGAEAERQRSERMYRYLGVLAGAAAAVLMV